MNFIDFVGNAFRVGNKHTFLDFNSKGDGQLRLRGTMIQSESGDENFVGVFRGVYDNNYFYYSGDEVAYTAYGVTSTFRYISANPARGIAPTSSSHWQLIASGGANGNDGLDGKSVEFIFTRQYLQSVSPQPPS